MYEKSDVIIGVFEKTYEGYYIFSSLTNGRGQNYFGKVFYLNVKSTKTIFEHKHLYGLSFSHPQYIGIENDKAAIKKITDWTKTGFAASTTNSL